MEEKPATESTFIQGMTECPKLSFPDQNCNSMTYKPPIPGRLIPLFLTIMDQKEDLHPAAERRI